MKWVCPQCWCSDLAITQRIDEFGQVTDTDEHVNGRRLAEKQMIRKNVIQRKLNIIIRYIFGDAVMVIGFYYKRSREDPRISYVKAASAGTSSLVYPW